MKWTCLFQSRSIWRILIGYSQDICWKSNFLSRAWRRGVGGVCKHKWRLVSCSVRICLSTEDLWSGNEWLDCLFQTSVSEFSTEEGIVFSSHLLLVGLCLHFLNPLVMIIHSHSFSHLCSNVAWISSEFSINDFHSTTSLLHCGDSRTIENHPFSLKKYMLNGWVIPLYVDLV